MDLLSGDEVSRTNVQLEDASHHERQVDAFMLVRLCATIAV
jgi:hypothetical protein